MILSIEELLPLVDHRQTASSLELRLMKKKEASNQNKHEDPYLGNTVRHLSCASGDAKGYTNDIHCGACGPLKPASRGLPRLSKVAPATL
jgi:hypothetical protein